MNFTSPKLRRTLTYATAGTLGGVAVGLAATGCYQSAHSLAMAGSAVMLAPTLVRNCPWFGPVVTDFKTSEPEVWITIDDGPHPENTPEILEVLSNHSTKATFFGIGDKILKWPHLAQAIKNEGHQLQNHTFGHPSHSFWAAITPRADHEVRMCSDAIKQVTGSAPSQFRAPVGIANPFVHASVEKAGLKMIGWSTAGLDGLPHQPERVVNKILRSVRPGAIILIHEGSLPGLRRGTRARTLDAVLRGLAVRGYRAILPAIS